MNSNSIIVLGGPDSGKTNYIGRLWLSLDSQQNALVAKDVAPNLDYVIDTAEHLCAGNFAPRSEHSDARRDFEVVVHEANGSSSATIVIPDISGELWRVAVDTGELDSSWMETLENASGALLFVRFGSKKNVGAMNWVTHAALMAKRRRQGPSGTPTQVMLCELFRFLELKLRTRVDGSPPRVALVVAAWDLVDKETFDAGPEKYLAKEFPLIAGKLLDTRLDVRVFGVSVVGGDLQDDAEYRHRFLDGSIHDHGWVALKNPSNSQWSKVSDLTLPVAWVVGL
ncbi:MULTISPECIES: hypothetical protein [Achromobacter]|uniref:Double-GTPase 1 domain-containing protein n=1 Tax=Achromobacter spanius TaxID=217203 RepID=A0ABY8GSE2_9BURK|nr:MULTISPECIES: hypothetical protein [Achromobacter]WAI83047.1 hypothetical protein N8Z00_26695 [Achromobacter spanius]WEX93132.1 hypothetical protein N3Z32_21290 [Achromobacter sp. SS2-2022]WFP07712.1 hypothetical protein P8T11_25970 [Achromobacter spanius]